MDKMNGESMNIERKNIGKLKELFPEVFTEDKIDFEKLQLVLGEDIEESEERYSFTWHGKRDAIRLSQTPTTGTLRPDKENSKNWDETENLYIEGDNLEVLKLLQKSYHSKIKMIYIDPPYNTGKDFVYKDNYRDNMKNYLEFTEQVDDEGHKLSTNTDASGRYHTDWLNMMYPRLRLARNLLTEDGVIFISIDDNEVHNLRKICDEIFGEDNFISELIWEKKKKPSFLNSNLGTKTEYILTYGKNRSRVGALSVDTTEIGKKYPLNNAGNGVRNITFQPNSVEFINYTNEMITAQDMSEGNIITELLTDLEIKDGYNANEFTLRGEWRYSQEKLNEIINNKEEIVISKIPFRPNHIKSGGEIKKIHNLLTTSNYSVGTNEDATSEQEKLFGKNYFDYAKPSSLIEFMIKALTYNDKDNIILDFFAGSSTTAHAVMNLNAADGGNRRYIMVQLPEPTDEKSEAYKEGYKTIADIGRERIRRAGEKILEENKDKEGIEDLDIGFKSFQLDTSNIKEWNPEYMEGDFTLEDLVNNFVPGRGNEDVLYEIILKYGIDLSTPIEKHNINDKTIYSVGMGSVYICLDNDIDNDVVEEILKLNKEYKMPNPIVVFKDIGFKNDEIKLNAKLTLNDNGMEEVVSI